MVILLVGPKDNGRLLGMIEVEEDRKRLIVFR